MSEALFIATVVTWLMGRGALLPVTRDPRLVESLAFENI